MPDFDSYFNTDQTERDSHPLVRLLDAQQKRPEFSGAKVKIVRPRAALGFEPAQTFVQFFNQQGDIYDYKKIEPWDSDLNDSLLDRHVRAIDETSEVQRFGLGLATALQQSENRYGDGFFNAVLMLVVDQSPFASMSQLRELRPFIATNRPYDRGHSIDDCSRMIQATLQDRWLELRRKLGYEKTEAERILAGALAYYLDERFSITDGRKLGWLKPN
jgi:hypothetical protein